MYNLLSLNAADLAHPYWGGEFACPLCYMFCYCVMFCFASPVWFAFEPFHTENVVQVVPWRGPLFGLAMSRIVSV